MWAHVSNGLIFLGGINMLSIAITISLVIGWILGLLSYFGFRIGYKMLVEVLEEEKKPSAFSLGGELKATDY